MRRPLLPSALALALVAPASARALSTFRLETDRAIRIEVINGFPQPPGAEGDVATFALDVWSQGARELVVDVDGPCRLHQKLAAPANERRRFFFYAPRLSGNDWSQAAMLRIAGLPGPESARTFGIPQLAQFSGDLQVGQLGRINSPVSVETGWALAGDLTAAFPGHWRGLSG